MKLAAIDIGSNAVRLLFSQVAETKEGTKFHKISLIRMPVRLGVDSFRNGRISPEHEHELVLTMEAYARLIEVYGAEMYMACATSALREAENGPEIVEDIRQRTRLDLQLIDGTFEAQLIYSTHIAETLEHNKDYLYIDVGGGSTELTLFSEREPVVSESFRIGTLRLVENMVEDTEWERMNRWLREHLKHGTDTSAIGTGGNINKLYKLSSASGDEPMTLSQLNELCKYLSDFSYEDRVNELGLRPDRADVIIPACHIYTHVMKQARIKHIHVPKVGLVDGMVHILYEKYKESQPEAVRVGEGSKNGLKFKV